jgi:hypothetical protein
MKKAQIFVGITCLFFFLPGKDFAQIVDNDSIKFDYRKIYSFCLDGNIKPVFALLEYDGEKKVSTRDLLFRKKFEDRFKYESDKSNFLSDKNSTIDSMLSIFQNYWRQSLLDSANKYDGLLWARLYGFLSNSYPALKAMNFNKDSVDVYAKKCIADKGLYMTDGIGKTGKLYDLLIWKTKKDTTYHFTLHNETTSARVIFMDDFITLGWEEYATLGKYYPGGWATSEALYCVKGAYDLTSEHFLVSYLAHESRHFADYKLFPKLTSADLEYRAKLTELSLAKQTLYKLIDFFIDNGNYNSDNGHSIANYCVIRDLTISIFKTEFEKDKSKWHKIDPQKINRIAYKLLLANTKVLKLKGKNVEKYIKL